MYKLLVVDDEKMIRMGMKNGIDWEDVGIGEVYTAASAREAMKVIEEEHPQIMITDISMTEMTGLDLIGMIRNEKKDKDMRIIVLTGYDRFDYARQCLRLRVQNFLLKPIDEEELKKSVRDQVERLEEIRIQNELSQKRMRAEGTRRQMEMEQFMRDLVHQRIDLAGDAGYPDELENENIRTAEVVILIPEVYMDKGTEQDLQKLTVKSICMDLIDARRAGVTFFDDDGKIILVFYNCDVEKNVSEKVEELSEILETECDIKPRVVLGSEVESLDRLFVSYNDAIYLLEQERKGFKEIVRTSVEQNREQIIRDIYREFKQAMITNIANGDRVMNLFGKFERTVYSYNLSKLQVQRWCVELASDIYFTYIMETGEAVDNRMESFMKALIGSGREEALEVTAVFIRNLVAKEGREQHEIIINARRYIDDHIEENLSVASLADMFYVSPNYFSRLFKKEMQEGCNEYIVKKRIEKSKFLLDTTTMKAGKIAMMVGYNDTNYFSLAFKKHTGMSPTKYREEMQKKEQ